jgi:hypothetical protein
MSQAKPPFKASPPPTSSQVATTDFPRGEGKLQALRQLAMATPQLKVICGLMPFDNGSSDWAQIQLEDGQ